MSEISKTLEARDVTGYKLLVKERISTIGKLLTLAN